MTYTIPIPAGYVYVLYDIQVDVSIPFILDFTIYSDGTSWFSHWEIPSTWYWKVIGWPPTKSSTAIVTVNASAVDTVYDSEIVRYLRFKSADWEAFEENFLHPLEYYAKLVMEKEL